MSVDPIIWITGVTALANMVSAVADALRSNVELDSVRQAANDSLKKGRFSIGESDIKSMEEMVISEELLQAFIEDIENAQRRFTKAINDPRYSPAEIDREEQRAQLTICEHLRRVKTYNYGRLPGSELNHVAESFRCFVGRRLR